MGSAQQVGERRGGLAAHAVRRQGRGEEHRGSHHIKVAQRCQPARLPLCGCLTRHALELRVLPNGTLRRAWACFVVDNGTVGHREKKTGW